MFGSDSESQHWICFCLSESDSVPTAKCQNPERRKREVARIERVTFRWFVMQGLAHASASFRIVCTKLNFAQKSSKLLISKGLDLYRSLAALAVDGRCLHLGWLSAL